MLNADGVEAGMSLSLSGSQGLRQCPRCCVHPRSLIVLVAVLRSFLNIVRVSCAAGALCAELRGALVCISWRNSSTIAAHCDRQQMIAVNRPRQPVHSVL